MKKITGVVVTTDNKVYKKDFDYPLFRSIGRAVGGPIEDTFPKFLPAPYCMVVNEEGLNRGLELNIAGSILYASFIHGSPIVGNVVFLKMVPTKDGDDLTGLNEDDIYFISNLISKITNGRAKYVELCD